MTKKAASTKNSSSSPLLVLDENYLPTLMHLLDQARSSIDILAFSFAIGSASGKLNTKSSPFLIAQKLVLLKKKFKSKIRIRLYVEGIRETADRNHVTAQFLEGAGIEIHYGSTHAKGFCIDNQYVLFGSTNLTEQSILRNSETNLLLSDSKAVEGFRLYFEHLWDGGDHGEITLPPPMIADGDYKNALIEMIHSAHSTLEFSIYFFYQTEIEKAFIAAHKRGVKVRGYVHDHNYFGLSYIHRTHAALDRLRKGGIQELFLGPKNLFTHSKYLIKDRKELLLGTGNWINEDIKIHPQLYIELKDSVLCQKLSRHLHQLIQNSIQRQTNRDVEMHF